MAAALVVAATPSLAATTALAVGTSARATTVLLPPSGVEAEPLGASSVGDFGSWRGRVIPVATDYLGTSTWSSMSQTQWAPQRWTGSPVHVVWSLAMLPSSGSDLKTEATGAYDHYFVQIAQQLVAGGQGASTIRLGWENTGDWFVWSGAKDPASYAAAWRQVVTAMRGVPGSDFTFDFSTGGLGGGDPTPLYPGDAYVDYIGGDFYDQSFSSSYPASDHARVWNEIANNKYGLGWLATFAAAHHKQVTIPEWGLAQRCDGHGGGDDPAYVQHMYDWITTHDVAYANVFDSDDDSCHRFSITSSDFPNAAALYRKLFSASSAPPLPTRIHVDFGPADVAPYPGYVRDTGQPFDLLRGSGWLSNTTLAPASLIGNGRARTAGAAPDTRFSTFLQIQQVTADYGGTTTPGRWVHPLANGRYYVAVAVGDPSTTDSVDTITVQRGTPDQVTLINGFTPTAARPWAGTVAVVDVHGGALTIDPTGGHNTKLDFIDVVPVPAGTPAPTKSTTTKPAKATPAKPVGALRVSTAASRRLAHPLAGRRLTGSKAYVFFAATAKVVSATFLLDGKRVRIDKSAPYDLVGSTGKKALALSLAKLKAGRHVLTVSVVTPGPLTRLVSVAFTVVRPGKA